MQKDSVFYKLEGRSLAAAKKLARLIEREYRKKPRGGDYQKFEAGLRSIFETEMPEEAKALGLSSPAIQVGKCGNQLRAYKTWPLPFQGKQGRFYLETPIDHQGKHFKPPGAKELTGNALQEAHQDLYEGMGESAMPMLPLGPTGIAPPQGRPKHLSETFAVYSRTYRFEAYSYKDMRYFLPDAPALQAAADFKKREADYEAAVKQLTEKVNEIVTSLHPKILARLPAGTTLRQYISYFNNDSEAIVTLDVYGPGNTRKPYLPDHPAFSIKDGESQSRITPRTDTVEGRSLAALFNAVPKKPRLEEEPALKGIASIEIKDIAGTTVLGVPAAEARKVPHLKPFDNDIKLWLDKDAEDLQFKIPLPPRPDIFKKKP